MDIRLDESEGKFKFRVCGILEHNNKYLVVKINDNDFYCLPGGHVELGEDTDKAVKREMQEELGFAVKIQRLVSVNQNFFKDVKGRNYHELGFYYIVNAVDETKINTNDYVRDELDKGKIQHLVFKWASLEELKTMDFRPKFIIDCLDGVETEISITRD